jgi:hypothetical protein
LRIGLSGVEKDESVAGPETDLHTANPRKDRQAVEEQREI